MLRLDGVETTLLKNFAIRHGGMGRSQQSMQIAVEDVVICFFNMGNILAYTEGKPPVRGIET